MREADRRRGLWGAGDYKGTRGRARTPIWPSGLKVNGPSLEGTGRPGSGESLGLGAWGGGRSFAEQGGGIGRSGVLLGSGSTSGQTDDPGRAVCGPED